jgi:hypothetical protein
VKSSIEKTIFLLERAPQELLLKKKKSFMIEIETNSWKTLIITKQT